MDNWLTLFLMIEGILVIVVLILSSRITNSLIRKVDKDLDLVAQFLLKDYQDRQAKVDPPAVQAEDQVEPAPDPNYRVCEFEHLRPYPDCYEECPNDKCTVEPAKPKRVMSKKAKDALAKGREKRKANQAKKAVTK